MLILIQNVGLFAARSDRNALARKYRLNWETVHRIYKALTKGIKEEEVEHIRLSYEQAQMRAISRMEKAMADDKLTNKERAAIAKDIIDSGIPITKFLEEWNRKKKVAEQINLTGDVRLDVDKILSIAREAAKDGSGSNDSGKSA